MASGCPESDAPLRPRSVVPARAVPRTPFDRIQFTDDTVDAEHLNRLETAIERALQRTSNNTNAAVAEVQKSIDTIEEHGGGVSGGGAVPVVDSGEWTGSTAGEDLVLQVPLNLGGLSAATLALRTALLLSSSAGTGRARAYLGGSFGSIVGASLVAQATTSSASLELVSLSGAAANPGGTGLVLFSLTLSPGQSTVARRLNGTIG